jgi:hypothetical protein
VVPALLAPIGLGFAVAGCATSSAEPAVSYQPADYASRNDGLPTQMARPFRIRQVTHDPSEPFSFNYGPLPPRRLSNAEADALIAYAIAEHEMRKP